MHSSNNLIMTRQRQVILDELTRCASHPTADELHRLVRKRMPRISLGTVYRNLEILAESGLVQKLEVAGNQKRFDGTITDHYHMRCVRCGRVEDAPVAPMPQVAQALREALGYRVLGHRLEFTVICPRCGGKTDVTQS
jgi:Fur family ferric uptake transcriptional regulator